MHIEPGLIAQTKILVANAAATATVALVARAALRHATELPRALLAALFFTFFMQIWHLPVGPSELHFVGAMVMYLTLGFRPTLLGFAAGLLLQGLLFEPADLMHLAVNTLTLIVPLAVIEILRGRSLRERTTRLDWPTILKLDASYYTGVTLMVGFWLSLSEVATPVAAWAKFASSYLAIVASEPLVTIGALGLVRRFRGVRFVQRYFVFNPQPIAD